MEKIVLMCQNDGSGTYEESLKARLKEVEGKLANIIKAVEKGINRATF